MPIRRLKPSSNEELITHISKRMIAHEEEYAVGAWEKFNQKEEQRPTVLLWMKKFSIAAALLFCAFGMFFYLYNKEVINTNNAIVAKPEGQLRQQPNTEDSNGTKEQDNPSNSVDGSRFNPSSTSKNDLERSQSSPIPIPYVEQLATVSKDIIADNSVNRTDAFNQASIDHKQSVIAQDPIAAIRKPEEVTIKTQEENIVKKPISIDEFLAQENKNLAANNGKKVKSEGNHKWDLGVVVAPSIGNNDKLNMGYGVSMAYNLTNKVSLGSGVSYNELGASRQIVGNSAPNSPSANALVNDTKSLESVNTRVTGIDIPLEVRYNISKRFYANVGVSAFAVINQQQNNVYLQGTVVQRSDVNLAGDVQFKSFLMTEKVSEKAPETISPNDKLIGFYNFSFGYKQKLSKDKSLGIEPFIKLPMRDVTKENLRLMGTGLKIKFDF
jgi:hypothetical protein